ncbi:MAG: hypothetical protein ACLQGP_17015 [Isosphaeraceae bacterium]
MTNSEPNERPIAGSRASTCCHLRSNGTYIFGSERDDTDDDGYSSSSCWCARTMKSFGPDDEMVNHRDCRDATRSCYEPL